MNKDLKRHGNIRLLADDRKLRKQKQQATGTKRRKETEFRIRPHIAQRQQQQQQQQEEQQDKKQMQFNQVHSAPEENVEDLLDSSDMEGVICRPDHSSAAYSVSQYKTKKNELIQKYTNTPQGPHRWILVDYIPPIHEAWEINFEDFLNSSANVSSNADPDQNSGITTTTTVKIEATSASSSSSTYTSYSAFTSLISVIGRSNSAKQISKKKSVSSSLASSLSSSMSDLEFDMHHIHSASSPLPVSQGQLTSRHGFKTEENSNGSVSNAGFPHVKVPKRRNKKSHQDAQLLTRRAGTVAIVCGFLLAYWISSQGGMI